MRLIDADALYDELYENMDEDEVLDRIPPCYVDNAPTVDAIPVIRCRDCTNWKPYGSKAARKIGDPLERYGGCEIWHGGHLETDFCSYGQAPIKKKGG